MLKLLHLVSIIHCVIHNVFVQKKYKENIKLSEYWRQ